MMKKVIFVCLLSLSVCFSLPSTPLNAAQQTPAVQQNAKGTEASTDAKAAEVKPEQSQTAAATTTTTPQAVTTNATAADVTKSPITNETKLADKNSTETKSGTDPAKPIVPATPVVPPKESNNTTPAGNVPANNGTNADSKDGKKNETTTPTGENVSPSVVPIQAKSRAFDGPSFIGGIILTLGLLAIGFMGFKYYKNQTERNYHTL